MSLKAIRLTALAATALLITGGTTMPAQAQQPKYSATYGNDRAEIEDLMARYLFAIDYHDWDAYVATFAPDGELEFARGTTKGREAIRETVKQFASRIGEFYHTADGKPATLRHIILQQVIRVEGDHAWARSQWLEMANHGEGDSPKIGTYGIYEDTLEKIDGQWLFTKRRVLNEFLKGRQSGPGNPVHDMDGVAAAFLAGQ